MEKPINEFNYPKRIVSADTGQQRCHIAANVLAALVSNPEAHRHTKSSLCRQAVEYADILLKELES